MTSLVDYSRTIIDLELPGFTIEQAGYAETYFYPKYEVWHRDLWSDWRWTDDGR
jgi:hypothetical protein